MTNQNHSLKHRRPLQTRNTAWAHSIARWLRDRGIKPNTISVMSALYALFAGLFLWLSREERLGIPAWCFLLFAVIAIQKRLLCNLFDGMVAIEGGLKTKTGELFNDVPDRFSDIFILVGAGYAIQSFAWGSDLGWLAATLAVMTAYTRLLGVSTGTESYFSGPMAKQHRMAVMTFAALFAIGERLVVQSDWVLVAALAVIALGSLVTIFRRLVQISAELESK
ncbi:MAG: hypothetical protein A2070_13245 [Bdellovibrionales bacterium GWC1_52_8]|nr:MAG: hypothetical protein A2Z97_00875 [Bdellovibrionales bacterium GWB1_52_6]OFZ05188.1 MAG: hypothetical protein A2X97_10365 [Bdellovibrionales bacterium GWA1_52_35]OFZ39267.1 MAG: hypothetical protein A2070_13245 [Bdellovibrionales bacterium GWC1_52_8]HCM38682.1 hypothetical protein [Bdellovibrionales bacterium]